MRPYRLHPGDPLNADDLNEQFEELARQSRVFAAPPIQITDDEAGQTISFDDGSFMAVVNPSSTSSCPGLSFHEVQYDDFGDWIDMPGGRQQPCGAFEWNGNTVPDNTIARLYPSGKPGEFVFWFGGDSSTTTTTDGTQIVRITNYFVKDDAFQTACDDGPSPLCYYPGVVQHLNCGDWIDTATEVWVVFWYKYASVPGIGTGPATVVNCTGSGAHTAKPMGFDYAPTNNTDDPVHPNSGESRPVYGSTEYAAGWAIQCDPDSGQPEITLGG